MNTEIEHLVDNNIRLTITIPETEFEPAIDKAFKSLAGQVRLPGFRPGKAPRAILEKQIGYEAGRSQALNDSLPEFYVDAITENDIDPVDYPELKLTSGEEEGDVVFEAVVAVRPTITVSGYDKLDVTLDIEPIEDEALTKQLESVRDRHATLEDTDDEISDGVLASIDIAGVIDGEDVPGLTATDYMYEVGSGIIGAELDKQLQGKKAGDTIEFTDELSEQFGDNAGEEVAFTVSVKNVQKKSLPEATDEWIKENTEFESRAAFDEGTRTKLASMQSFQAKMQLQQKVMESLSDIVTDEIPEAFIEREVNARLESMAQQSNASRDALMEYINAMDDDAKEEFNANMRKDAETAIKSDLALRAIIVQEELDANDEELEAEIAKFAESSGEKINKIRNRVKKPGVEKQVRLDIARAKAVKLVTDSAIARDSAGNEIALQNSDDDGDEMSMINDMIASMGAGSESHDHDDHDHTGHNHD